MRALHYASQVRDTVDGRHGHQPRRHTEVAEDDGDDLAMELGVVRGGNPVENQIGAGHQPPEIAAVAGGAFRIFRKRMATRPQELRDFDRFVRTCFPGR